VADRGDTSSEVLCDVEIPMEAGETAPTEHPPATEGGPTESASQLSLPDRLRGQRDETRPGSDPWTGRRDQPKKGCRGPPSQFAAGNGPKPLAPGDRYGEPSQGTPRASARRVNTGTRTLWRRGTGGRRRVERTSKGKQAHGRHERRTAGNGGTSQRTRQRSKASKSAAPPEGAHPWNPETGTTEGHHELRRTRG
jgi:hypothetical protein